MSLRIEYPYNNNDNLIRRYSDDGHLIRQIETGNLYGEAIDIYPSKYSYEEAEELIEPETLEENSEVIEEV